MRCPHCRLDLEGCKTTHGVVYRCASCAGEALGMAVVRKRFAQAAANAIWRGTRGGQGDVPAGAPCPTCEQTMAAVALGEGPSSFTLDGCERCAVVWFDASETERLPEAPRAARAEAKLTPEQAEAHVTMQLGAATSQGAFDAPYAAADAVHDAGTPRWLAYFSSKAWLSLTLGALLLLFHLGTFFDLRTDPGLGRRTVYERLADDYAFDPARPWRRGGLTLVTSFLVSPGGRSLGVTAMLLLPLAGHLLERRLGRVRFLGLLALGHAAALSAYAIAGLPRGAGLLGAAAGVAALLGWAAVILGRAYMNERRLRGAWWAAWHGAGGAELRPLLVLGFAIWFVFAAITCLSTPWEDLTMWSGRWAGQARSTPAAFVGGLLGLVLGVATLLRVGTGPAPGADEARRRG